MELSERSPLSVERSTFPCRRTCSRIELSRTEPEMKSAVSWTCALSCGAVTDQNQSRSFLPERTVFGRSFLPERTFAEKANLCEVRRGKPGSPARQAGPTSCSLHSGFRPKLGHQITAKGLAKAELIFTRGNRACQSTETAVRSMVATIAAGMTNGTSMRYSRNSFAILRKQNGVVTRCKSMSREIVRAISSFHLSAPTYD